MPPTATRITTLAAALALCFAVPAAAQEATDGTTFTAASTGGAQAVIDQPGLVVSPGALLDRTVRIRGTAETADAGRRVRIDRQLENGTWQEIASDVVGPDGRFRARWRTDRLGRTVLRAVVERAGTAAVAAAVPLTAPLTVFERAVATWYGPGFFGRRTACGQRLTRRTVGVAHRTLPCGTRVELYHRGRVLTVPVIDRGPFEKGRDWDLTMAAARKIGMRTTSTIGFLPPPEMLLERERPERQSLRKRDRS